MPTMRLFLCTQARYMYYMRTHVHMYTSMFVYRVYYVFPGLGLTSALQSLTLSLASLSAPSPPQDPASTLASAALLDFVTHSLMVSYCSVQMPAEIHTIRRLHCKSAPTEQHNTSTQHGEIVGHYRAI